MGNNGTPPSHPASDGGRGKGGTFGRGNQFGKGGNPYLRRVKYLKAHLLAAATPEQIRAIVGKMGEQAAAGDVASARVYLDHVLGRPSQSIALTDGDGEPLLDLAKVKVAILAAIGDDPDVRHRAAKALLALGSGGDGDESVRAAGG